MNMKTAPALVRATMLCPVILFGLLVTPLGFLAGFTGGAPNQFTTPFMEQWPLFKVLWASNPGAAIQILMQQPLMVIAHGEPTSVLPVWRLVFYLVHFAALLAVSIFAAVTLSYGARGTALHRLVLLLPGMALLVFVATYVQLAVCCTGGPRWVLDVWLYSQASNPLSTSTDWQQFYLRIEGVFSIMQAVLALLGVALLMVGARRAEGVKARR